MAAFFIAYRTREEVGAMAQRAETEADCTKDAGGESGRSAFKYKRTKAREEGSTLPFLAGR